MKFFSNKVCLQYEESAKPPKDYLRIALRDLKDQAVYFVLGFVVGSVFLLSTYLLVSGLESARPTLLTRQRPTHKLGVVVPFRDRFNELATFVPHISRFLSRQSIEFEIYVVNQVDDLRFNRASLINIGFLAALRDGCDYVAMHDVDLLPLNDQLDYSYPASGRPFHVSAPGLHPDYSYATFIGGILLVTSENFLLTNGMSNNYWGWGKEDDEFYLRLKEANLTVARPRLGELSTGRANTFWHNHDASARPRDRKRFVKQKSASLRKDDSGLDSVQYRLRGAPVTLSFDQYKCQLLNVELFCNKQVTHWCDYKYQFL